MPTDEEREKEEIIEQAELEVEAEEPEMRPAPPAQERKPSIFDVVKQKAGEVVGGVRADMARRSDEDRAVKAAEKEARAMARAQAFEERKTKAAARAGARETERSRPIGERLAPVVEKAQRMGANVAGAMADSRMGAGRYAEFTRRASTDSRGRMILTFDGEGGTLRSIVGSTGGENKQFVDNSGGQMRAMLSPPQRGRGGMQMAPGGSSSFGSWVYAYGGGGGQPTRSGKVMLRGLMSGGGQPVRPGRGGRVRAQPRSPMMGGLGNFGGSRIGMIAKGSMVRPKGRARRRRR